MGRYKKLFMNTAVLAIGTFASKFLVFFMMPLYTGCLLPEEYSTADLITQSANLLMPLACAGITNGVFRFAMDDAEDKRSIFSSGLAVLMAISAVFAVLSPLIGLFDALDGYVVLVIFYVLAANIHAVVAQYIRAKGNTVLFSVGGIIGTMIVIALNLLFLLVFDMGVNGYVLSIILSDVIVAILLFFIARLYRDVDFDSIRRSKIVEMLKYSIPMIPTTVFWWITSVSDRYLVIAMKGSEVNGLYAAAYKVPTLLTLVCTVFIEAWQFSAIDEKNKDERSVFFTNVFAGFQGVMFMAASGLVLVAKPVTAILLDESYYASWEYIPILSLAMAFSALVTFMGSVYMVSKKSMHSFLTAALGAGTNIVLNILLIPKFSAMGAAFATFVSYFVVLIFRGIDARKMVHFGLCIPRLAFNTVVLLVQCVLTVMEIKLWLVWDILLFLAIVVVNGRNILASMLGVLRNLQKKTKKS